MATSRRPGLLGAGGCLRRLSLTSHGLVCSVSSPFTFDVDDVNDTRDNHDLHVVRPHDNDDLGDNTSDDDHVDAERAHHRTTVEQSHIVYSTPFGLQFHDWRRNSTTDDVNKHHEPDKSDHVHDGDHCPAPLAASPRHRPLCGSRNR